VDTGVFAQRYALAAVHATIGLAGQHKANQYAGHETAAHLDGLPQHPQRALRCQQRPKFSFNNL